MEAEKGCGCGVVYAFIVGIVVLFSFARSFLKTRRSLDKKHVVREPLPQQSEYQIIIVDTETTGFGPKDQIVQIAAKYGDSIFSVHILPTVPFSSESTEITKLYVRQDDLWRKRGNPWCRLILGDFKLKTISHKEGAQLFIGFLRQCGSRIILVGHNLLRFDLPRIVSWLQENDLHEELFHITYGFTDTLSLLKQSNTGKQEVLARRFLRPYWQEVINEAHDALADCRVLAALLEYFDIDVEILRSKAIPTKEFVKSLKTRERKRKYLAKLKGLRNYVSAGMLDKMALAGVSTEELIEAYRSERKGLEECLGREEGGKTRVTRSKRIIDKVEEFIRIRLENYN